MEDDKARYTRPSSMSEDDSDDRPLSYPAREDKEKDRDKEKERDKETENRPPVVKDETKLAVDSRKDDPIAFSRDEFAKNLEEKGVVSFRVVYNDGGNHPEMLMDLINLKCIFATQLPKMPKEYIVRLVLDRNHRSMAIVKDNQVIGGICFRPFPTQKFAEIVFCAIKSSEQVKGYGTRIMNHLKEHVKTEDVEYFLTYADNYAIGYFRKQGFTKQVSMPKERWRGYIKDYDGGTLMECKINNKVNYLDIRKMVQQQREVVYQRIKEISNSHSVYPGLTCFKSGELNGPLKIESIPGVLESNWGASGGLAALAARTSSVEHRTPFADLQAKLGAILKQLKNLKDSWPFLQPVDEKLVPDYYRVITNPMDLATMSKKLHTGQYTTKEQFVADFQLVVSNCRTYNPRETTYYRCADAMEEVFHTLVKKIGL